MTALHPAVEVVLAEADPHRGHEHDDVNGHPHPLVCLTCSTDEDQVQYFRLEVDDEMIALAAAQAAAVVRWLSTTPTATDDHWVDGNLVDLADEIAASVQP